MKRAFTLIELLVASAIMGVVVMGIFAVLDLAQKSWSSDMGLVDIQQEVRQAMDGMIREVRQAKSETGRVLTIGGGGTELEFYIPDYPDAIDYYLVNNELIREHPANTTKVLVRDVSNLTFCCVHGSFCDTDCSISNVLRIQLAASKTVKGRVLVFPADGPLTRQVRLRNE